MRREVILVSFVFLFILLANTGELELAYRERTTQSVNEIHHESYSNHESIVITDNQNFSQLGFSGNGTETNPFQISDYNITGYPAVNITNTNSHFVISNCLISDNLVFLNVTNGVIANCTINGDDPAIRVYRSANCYILGNFVNAGNSGIWIDSSINTIIGNNTITGGKDHYMDILIRDSSYCEIYENSFMATTYGVYGDNCTDIEIRNQYMDNRDWAIYLEQCLHISIHHVTITTQSDGVYLLNSEYSNITDSEIFSTMTGIYNYHSNHTWINNVYFHNSEVGVYLRGSQEVYVEDSEIDSCVWGVQGYNSIWIHISECNLTSCKVSAFEFTTSRFIQMDFNILTNNSIEQHPETYGAIQLFGTNDSVIESCDIRHNSRYGIFIGPKSENTTSFTNKIGWNSLGNAFDNGTQTNWDNGTFGNWWSDYSGTGEYLVPGSGGSFDRYPMVLIGNSDVPTISSPDDITFFHGSWGYEITWTVSDDNPQYLELYLDGTLQHIESWNATTLNYSTTLQGLHVGTYEYMLKACDQDGHNNTDVVMVTVEEDTIPPTISSPPDMTFREGESGTFIEWNVSDNNPQYYVIFLNDSTITWGNCNSTVSTIILELKDLSVGAYNYTLLVSDSKYNVSDSVIVTVLSESNTPPWISSPDDVTYVEGEIGNQIQWQFSDSHPNYYEIRRNNTVINWGWWSTTNETLTVNVDDLVSGVYAYMIVVSDKSWTNSTDEVIVTVLPDNNLDITKPDDIEYLVGTIGNRINWTLLNGKADGALVYRNGTLILSSDWSESSIIVNIDYLTVGIYNYTLVASNGNQSVSDTVWVEVYSEQQNVQTTNMTNTNDDEIGDYEMLTTTISWTITIGSLVVIIYFVLKIHRSSKTSKWETMMEG